MFEAQTAFTRTDERNRCRDRSWLSTEDEKRFGVSNPVVMGEYNEELVGIEPLLSTSHYEGLIYVGQNVFLAGGKQLYGLTTKLFISPGGQISHLAVRAARLFGSHKVVPISAVIDVTPFCVQLSITGEQFKQLPEYQTDANLTEEVDKALWKDVVLRDTDYYEIDAQVRNGFLSLNGHVTTNMNRWRAETAVKKIPGILGVNSHLITDDKLLLEVSEALGQIEKVEECKFFPKVEHGLAVLMGKVSSTALRDQAGQIVAEIPWVRGVINEILVPGVIVDPGDQRFLQPLIGKELIFKDALSVTIRKVVIDPRSRRVIAVIVFGKFPLQASGDQHPDNRGESNPEQQMVLPVGLVQYLTRNAGFLRINSDETAEYIPYDPSQYHRPAKGWQPPYPYCTDEVLIQAG